MYVLCMYALVCMYIFPVTQTVKSCLKVLSIPQNEWIAVWVPGQAVMLFPYRGFLQAVKQVVVLGFEAGAGFANKGLLILRGLLTQRR